MPTKKYLKQIVVALCFFSSSYAASSEEAIDNELALGRELPAYFKIMAFEKARWEAFSDAFSDHPVAQNIKKNLESIQLTQIVFSREAIFSSEFFKRRMRDEYTSSYRKERDFAPPINTVDSDGMYAAILSLLAVDSEDSTRFNAYIDAEMIMYEKIITAYNHRLAARSGNSALLKHFLSKIFFAQDAYSNSTLINMRMILLAEGLVAGDDYLFATEKNTSHTLSNSIFKYMELEGATDTLVIGCGHSLVADVVDTPAYLADDFLKMYTGKTFVYDCQHCLCNHENQIAVALTEGGLEAKISYDGAAHADIYANATTPEFWNALISLKNEGRSPIKCIIDHAYMFSDRLERIANSLDIGGIFRTYLDLTSQLALYGFELRGMEKFGKREEKVYVKVR